MLITSGINRSYAKFSAWRPNFTSPLLLTMMLIGFVGGLLGERSQSWAGDSKITATVNRENISIKQTVSVNVVAEIAGVTNQARLIEPSWGEQGWQVLGRSQMTQMQIINRSRSLEVTYTYQLRPTRQGTLVIGPFKGAGTARGLVSNTLKIKVSAKAPPRSQAEKQKNNQYAQIKWKVDKQEVWLGERIDASLVVYVRNKLRLTDLSVPDINLQGFWAEEAEPPRRSPFVSLQGATYSQKVIKRDLLTPLKAGALSLPSFDVNLVVGTHSFFTETQEVPQTVPSLKIKVKALPPNAPKGFRGPTVGQVQVQAMLDRKRVRADDGVQLNIKTTTTGLLANTPAIELPYVKGLRIFPPTERTNTQNVGGKVRSVRTQTWLIKPERSGRFTIPKVSLPFFNPRTGEYDFAKSRALTFTVVGEPKAQNNAIGFNASNPTGKNQSNSVSKEAQKRLSGKTAQPNAAEKLGVNLKSIMTEPVSIQARAIPRWFWWLLGLFGPLALVLSEVMGSLRLRNERTASSRAQGRAGKTAIKAIEAISVDPFDFAALDEAIGLYLEARFQTPFRGLTREQASEHLKSEGLSQELISGYTELVEVIDFARFAPGAGQDQGQEAQRLAKIWIKLAEKQLKESTKSNSDKLSQVSIIFTLLLSLTALSFTSADAWAAPAQAQAQSAKQQSGDHFFWSGDYQASVQAYQRQIKQDPEAAHLWYNLGTAYAYGGEFGQASYALHRAELIAPKHSLIAEQIELVNQAISEDGVRRPGQRRLVLPDEITSSGGVLALFTTAMTEALSLLCFSLACLVFLVIRRQKDEAQSDAKSIKRLASLRVLAVVLIVISALSGLSWWAKAENDALSQGIVVANRAALYRGPGEQYEVEVNVAGGVKLELQGEREAWRRVKLSDGREGWMSTKDLKALP